MNEYKIVEIKNLNEWKRTLNDLLKYAVFPESMVGENSNDLVYDHLFVSQI